MDCRHDPSALIIATILHDQLGLRPVETLDLSKRFVADLGADSLDIVELAMAFEDEFGVEVPDADLEKLVCGNDALAWLRAKGYPVVEMPTVAEIQAEQPANSDPIAALDKLVVDGTELAPPPTPPTMQELFDRVVVAIFNQGRPALDDGSCSYRGDGGAKCAVGHIITDEVYAQYNIEDELGGRPFNSLETCVLPDSERVRDAVIKSVGPLDQRSLDLLAHLQRAHDRIGTLGGDHKLSQRDYLRTFQNRVGEIAMVYSLNMGAANYAFHEALAKLAEPLAPTAEATLKAIEV